MRFRVARGEPGDAGANVGSAVDDQGLTSGGDDVLIEAIDVGSVDSGGHVVLALDEALLDGQGVGLAPTAVSDGEATVSATNFGYAAGGGDSRIGGATQESDEGPGQKICGSTKWIRDDAIDVYGHAEPHRVDSTRS